MNFKILEYLLNLLTHSGKYKFGFQILASQAIYQNSFRQLKKSEEKNIFSLKFLDSESIFGIYFPQRQNSFHCI